MHFEADKAYILPDSSRADTEQSVFKDLRRWHHNVPMGLRRAKCPKWERVTIEVFKALSLSPFLVRDNISRSKFSGLRGRFVRKSIRVFPTL